MGVHTISTRRESTYKEFTSRISNSIDFNLTQLKDLGHERNLYIVYIDTVVAYIILSIALYHNIG
jgi:hypothetical protein